MATHQWTRLLQTLLAAALAAGASWSHPIHAADPLEPPPEFVRITSKMLPDGRQLIGGALKGEYGYQFAVGLLLPNTERSLDPQFGYGGGLLVTGVWGYYDFVWAFALDYDGKILVGGNAADPIGKGDPQCHPAFCKHYPVVFRLNPDGTFDTTFNNGRWLIFAVGDGNSGREVTIGTLSRIVPDGDGYLVYDETTAIGRLNADGTLDSSFRVDPLASEATREVLFVDDQGLWYDPADPGWGINVVHQDNVMFATWATYDTDGRARWLSMTANRVDEAVYRGTLYETRGPSLDAPTFAAGQVRAIAVGEGTLMIDDTYFGTGAFEFRLDNGATQRRNIARQTFGIVPHCVFGTNPESWLITNYQDLWYQPTEPGWGLTLTHQGDAIFAIWFTYDLEGAPSWLSGVARKTGDRTFAGTLNRTSSHVSGAAPGSTGGVTAIPVGTYTLSFADGRNGTFAYSLALGDPPRSVAGSKSITRQVLRDPGTICE